MAGSSQEHPIGIYGRGGPSTALPILGGSSSARRPSSSLNEWLDQGIGQSHDQRRMHKVPKMLRKIHENTKCYDPMVVSIGPYHHGNSDLEQVEKLKTTIAKQFGRDCCKKNEDPDTKIDELYKKVKATNAREFYLANSIAAFDEESFSLLMFLDGCFVLYFIDCIVNRKLEMLKMKNDQIALVLRDLFLLENQLPFIVLEELVNFRFPGDQSIKLINKFFQQETRISDSSPWLDPLHLLDILRNKLLKNVAAPNISSQNDCSHFLDFNCISPPSSSPDEDWQSFRSINELRAVGIKCRKSSTSSFKDVHFQSGLLYGYLSLPSIVIHDSTKTRLLNLVAYEACPGAPDDFAITSYICFLDSLINSADDVKELRSKGILQNFLGSDKQVAKLFKDLTINLVPNPSHYGEVKGMIEGHYQKKSKIWIAGVLHTHFSSPWTVVAFVAAFLALFLLLIETIYTISPQT